MKIIRFISWKRLAAKGSWILLLSLLSIRLYAQQSATTTTSTTFPSGAPAGFANGVNLADNPTLLPGRSVILSVVFGFSPKH